MYIKVRPMTGGSETVFTVSKLTKIEELRLLIQQELAVLPEQQRLFFQGKQLVDGHTVFDYNINVNDVIQLMVRQVLGEATNTTVTTSTTTSSSKCDAAATSPGEGEEAAEAGPDSSASPSGEEVTETQYYRVGDLVDAQLEGSWWEAEVLQITPSGREASPPPEGEASDGFLYHVRSERYHYEEPAVLRLHQLRPRAFRKLQLQQLRAGDRLMANYNIDQPALRGYWYHCQVESVVQEGRRRTLVVRLQSGSESLSGCVIVFTDELLAIPDHVLLTDRLQPLAAAAVVRRECAPACEACGDSTRRRCRECGCRECGGKQDPHQQLMCDECDKAFHIFCLRPPLPAVPDVAEWFCPSCKNDETEIVRAGEKLKESRKKAKMPSKRSECARDWGKGYACVGRSKECTIVPSDHFGAVPGVEVGASWLYRIQASEAGVHRPPVSGIHGRADQGAYSLVLAGGYEDDEDGGAEFTYTGAGGRDLSGNRRTAPQSCDQTLTKTNRALALNCHCKLSEGGGDAGASWREGRPIRVLRSHKGRRHSEYAPEEGIRYDGLYKVVRYWQEAGKSGHKVWRYQLRRDDLTPSPWTEEGAQRVRQLGLVMQVPADKLPASDLQQQGGKRKRPHSQAGAAASDVSKKAKSAGYELPVDVAAAIAADIRNEKLWAACSAAAATAGLQELVQEVQRQFSCVCCQEVLLAPVTTPCCHNVCQSCLKRSFEAEVHTCPSCRHDLEGDKAELVVNEELSSALRLILPGYRGTCPPRPL